MFVWQADIAAGRLYRTAATAPRCWELSLSDLSGPDGNLFQDWHFDRRSVDTGQTGRPAGIGIPLGRGTAEALGADLKLYPNPVALAAGSRWRPRRRCLDSSWHRGCTRQKTGGYPGIQIKVAEPDERVQAVGPAGASQSALCQEQSGPGKALRCGYRGHAQIGRAGDILKADGLDPSAPMWASRAWSNEAAPCGWPF